MIPNATTQASFFAAIPVEQLQKGLTVGRRNKHGLLGRKQAGAGIVLKFATTQQIESVVQIFWLRHLFGIKQKKRSEGVDEDVFDGLNS